MLKTPVRLVLGAVLVLMPIAVTAQAPQPGPMLQKKPAVQMPAGQSKSMPLPQGSSSATQSTGGATEAGKIRQTVPGNVIAPQRSASDSAIFKSPTAPATIVTIPDRLGDMKLNIDTKGFKDADAVTQGKQQGWQDRTGQQGDAMPTTPEGQRSLRSSSEDAKKAAEKADFATGKWKDTFEGERFNARGGGSGDLGAKSSSRRPRDFSGGGADRAKDDPEALDQKTGGDKSLQTEQGAKQEALDQMTGGDKSIQTEQGAKEEAFRQYTGGMTNDEYKAYSEQVKKEQQEIDKRKGSQSMPKDDDTGGGTWVPVVGKGVPLEKAVGRGMTTPGKAGGPGDGRGEQDKQGSSGFMADKAVETKVGSTDKEIKRPEGGAISMEEALKANRYTDPVPVQIQK